MTFSSVIWVWILNWWNYGVTLEIYHVPQVGNRCSQAFRDDNHIQSNRYVYHLLLLHISLVVVNQRSFPKACCHTLFPQAVIRCIVQTEIDFADDGKNEKFTFSIANVRIERKRFNGNRTLKACCYDMQFQLLIYMWKQHYGWKFFCSICALFLPCICPIVWIKTCIYCTCKWPMVTWFTDVTI